MTEAVDTDLELLLDYLKRTRGFDFTAYKRPTLMRRIQKRMHTVGMATYSDYTDYLEVHPDEFAQLFNTILINVTDFFRDETIWDVIAQDVLPRILANKQPGDLIRVWSAGCASGQEAYTIAMLLAEALGEEEFVRRVKIYATDVDEAALNEARQATYTPQQVQNVPALLLDKYFAQSNTHYNFKKDLRRALIFGRHDLYQDAPISKIDLLLCRNTLMYFNAEAQNHIVSHFDFAVNGGGFLFLGKAETLLLHNSTFIPLESSSRIFAKPPKSPPPERRRPPAGGAPVLVDTPSEAALRLREAALDQDPIAQVVADTEGRLVVINAQARQLFGLLESNLGQRLQDLSMIVRPFAAELRLTMDQALAERHPNNLKDLEWGRDSLEKRYLDITVLPLADDAGELLGLKLIFIDVTRYHYLQAEIQRSHQNLETVNDELHSSNEELETTNEELQSTVEELETTNEELQSTNEELETMNEELQSTNAELETANEELALRSDELNRASAFLSSILAGLPDGVTVLDRNLQVLAWNSRSEDLWGLRANEVRGQHFFNLDIGLPVEQLKNTIRACLAGEADAQETTLAATNRRGKAIQVKVICNPLLAVDKTLQGAILVMEELKAAESHSGDGAAPNA